jgi:hypothetical protein
MPDTGSDGGDVDIAGRLQVVLRDPMKVEYSLAVAFEELEDPFAESTRASASALVRSAVLDRPSLVAEHADRLRSLPLQAETRRETGDDRYCGACGAEVGPTATDCAHCETRDVTIAERKCPGCGALDISEGRLCDDCGLNIRLYGEASPDPAEYWSHVGQFAAVDEETRRWLFERLEQRPLDAGGGVIHALGYVASRAPKRLKPVRQSLYEVFDAASSPVDVPDEALRVLTATVCTSDNPSKALAPVLDALVTRRFENASTRWDDLLLDLNGNFEIGDETVRRLLKRHTADRAVHRARERGRPVLPELLWYLDDDDLECRRAGARGVAALADRHPEQVAAAVPRLRDALRDGDHGGRRFVAEALADVARRDRSAVRTARLALYEYTEEREELQAAYHGARALSHLLDGDLTKLRPAMVNYIDLLQEATTAPELLAPTRVETDPVETADRRTSGEILRQYVEAYLDDALHRETSAVIRALGAFDTESETVSNTTVFD